MSSQQQFTPGSGGTLPKAVDTHPDCPRCKTQMALKQVSPMLFASDIDEMHYRCDGCGTEIKPHREADLILI